MPATETAPATIDDAIEAFAGASDGPPVAALQWALDHWDQAAPRFLQMLANGGTLDGKRYLGARTIAYMTSDHMGDVVRRGPFDLLGPGVKFGLGFAVRTEAGLAPIAGSIGDYSWGGAGGTAFWVDPKEKMFVVYMMQSPSKRLQYRVLLRAMVYAAIAE